MKSIIKYIYNLKYNNYTRINLKNNALCLNITNIISKIILICNFLSESTNIKKQHN